MIVQQRTLSEVIKAHIEARLVDVHTALPARVVSYDRLTRRASVQPLIKAPQKRETGTTIEAMPVLSRVPVLFQGTSRNGITFPLQEGDLVWVMFSEQSLDNVLVSDGEVTDPKSPARFTLRGAVCIPGFNANTVSDQSDDAAMVMHGDEIKLGSKDATSKVALVPGVEQAIRDAFTSASLNSAQAAYVTAIATGIPATIAAALADLNIALNDHFTAHPVQGAQKVEAE